MSDRLVTDPPDPDCYICDGRGVVGGCPVCRDLWANTPEERMRFRAHQHTYSFCRCVNERTVKVTDDE